MCCAFLAACAVGTAAGYALFSNPVQEALAAAFGRVNLVQYAIICAAVIFSYLLFYHLVFCSDAVGSRACGRLSGCRLLAALPLALNGAVLLVMFINEPVAYVSWLPRYADAYAWHQMPLPAFMAIECALCGAMTLLLARAEDTSPCKRRRADAAYWIVGAGMALLVGYSMYCINPFLNLYHVNAYYQPVLYVLNRVPFGPVHNSIYGHYAFFFAPAIRLMQAVGLGSVMRCFSLLIAGVALLGQLLIAYVLYGTVKNRLIRMLGIVAAGFSLLVIRDTTYQQLWPHRIFPIALMAAAMVFAARHERRRALWLTLGYLAAIVCLTWSTEIGLFALAGWTCYLIVLELQSMRKKWWIHCIEYLLGAVMVFFAVWAITDVYNQQIALGGARLTLNEFMFPLLVRYYMTERLELELVGKLSTWVIITGLLLFYVCRGLASTRICRKEAEKSPVEALLFAMAVMLLGSYSYAINRPVYGHFTLGYELIVVLLCVLASEAMPYVRRLAGASGHTDADEAPLTGGQSLFAGMGLSVCCVLLSLAFWCVFCTQSRMEYRHTLSDPEVTTRLYQDSRDKLPEGTKAFGFGAVEMFGLFDLDTVVYNMNYMDIEIDGPAPKEYADRLLAEAVDDPVVISEECLDMHREWGLGGYDAFMQTHTLAEVWGEDYGEPAFPCKLMYFVPRG